MRHPTQLGFTLIEVVFALAIVSLALTIVIPTTGSWIETARESATRLELESLADAGQRYFEDLGTLPASLQALLENTTASSGWDGPYATPNSGLGSAGSEFEDGWGNPYSYQALDAQNAVITSPGLDRTLQSEGAQAGGDDILLHYNIHEILRRETDKEIEEINAAITSYNMALFNTEGPLVSPYSAVLLTLKTKGFILDPTGKYNLDGWGRAYLTDQQPVQRVFSLGTP